MSNDERDAGPDEAYCVSCGEVIPADSGFCPECGAEQVIGDASGAEQADSGGGPPATDDGEAAAAGGGFTDWAIGFAPGATGRNLLVGVAYFLFYFVGVPLLVYAYWRRGGTYRKRLYVVAGVIVAGFVALAAIGALVGPTETSTGDGATSGDAAVATATPTPTPEPSAEYAVRVRYAGSWQGALSVTGDGSSQTESISGTGSREIEITGDVDIVSANAQKQDDSARELTIQILHEGQVVAEASTSAEYGVAQTSQSF